MSAVVELGYSLHLKGTEIINEFLETVQREQFQYLEEILQEAKKVFGSRQAEHNLLPKTPCMKKRSKRKRNPVTSESDENTISGSPEIEDQPKSEKSKKQKLFDSSPASSSVLEPLNENEVLDTSAQTSGRQLRPRACKTKSTARQQPVRTTRSSRRKLISVPEDESKNQKELEAESVCGTVVDTPKKATKRVKSKKTEFSQKDHAESNHIATVEDQEVDTPVMQKSESVNQPMIPSTPQAQSNQLCVSDAPEILVPETPVLSSPAKLHKSTINVILSPVVIKDSLEKEKNECPGQEQESPSELNQNGRKAEVLTNHQKSPGHVSEPSRPLNECSSVENKISRKSQEMNSKKRKSSTAFDTDDGNMQVSEDVNDGEEKHSLVSSTTPALGENKKMRTKEQLEVGEIKENRNDNKHVEETDHNTSVQESSIVSSTVKSPEKKKRCSSRWVRKSLKSSVRTRSSNTKNTKSLIKSSIKVKLSHKKLMPELKIPLYESSSAALNDTHRMSACSVQFDGIKQNLFGADEKSENEKCSGSSSDDQSAGAEDDGTGHSSESSENANRSISDDPVTSSQSSSKTKSTNESPSSTSSEGYSTPKSNGTSSEDEVFEDAKDNIVTQPQPSSPVHPALRKSGESKATVVLTKVQVKASNIATIHSFIKRNTPKKVDLEHKKMRLQMQIKQKEEREKEIREKLEQQRQKEIEERKRKRKEKEKRAAALRAAKAKLEQEKKRQMEEKIKQLKEVDEKVKKKKELEEEAKRKLRDKKKADLEARRKQEEEARQQKIQELEEEHKKQQELQRRKHEFEEEERKKRIAEAKRLQELREQELERERQTEKQRILNEIEEKQKRQRELHERQEREQKARDEKEKERVEREKKNKEEREKRMKQEKDDYERKRLAQLFKEKEEQERKEREKRQQVERERWEKEKKQREEAVREKRRQEEEKERQRIFEEKKRAEEEKRKALLTIDSYEMTPPPPPKVRKATTGENYDISDLNSDDSTDDEDAPRKRVPHWAQGPALKATMINQELMHIDTDMIFGPICSTLDLDDCFKVKRKRFYQRTSSAIWHSPPMKYLLPGKVV